MSIKDWDLHTEKMDDDDRLHAVQVISNPEIEMREIWNGSQHVGYVRIEYVKDIIEAAESEDED